MTTVIFANRSYAVLGHEFTRVGATGGGHNAATMLDLYDPSIDWVRLAESMGVEATRVETGRDFDAAFTAAVTADGPHLIEAVI